MNRFELHLSLCASVIATALIGSALLLHASGASASNSRSDPTCTPDIIVTVVPGVVDATGSGSGEGLLVATSPGGAPLPDTVALVEWSYRAIIRESGEPHRLGGFIDLRIATGSGEIVTFTSNCIAAVVTFGPDGFAAIYANGLVTGWPGAPGNTARRAFVHFHVWTSPDGTALAYVAIVGGKDCSLNSDALIVTPEHISGVGDSAGETTGFQYTETDCTKSKSGHHFNSTQ